MRLLLWYGMVWYGLLWFAMLLGFQLFMALEACLSVLAGWRSGWLARGLFVCSGWLAVCLAGYLTGWLSVCL